MRKILFRAKDEATGKWIYGYPVINDKGSLFMFEENSKEHNCYSCIKNTLGQYTSLNDKIGRRIFEGDIIKRIYVFNGVVDIIEIYKIIFIDGAFSYVAENDDYSTYIYDSNFAIDIDDFEVIGNVHDNPELQTNNL